jgi:diguanylate cyclase (GGDEF)-like protein
MSIFIGIYTFLKYKNKKKNYMSMTAISAMEHIREGFILIDEANKYQFSNKSAATMLPEIDRFPKGENISIFSAWPAELKDLENGITEFTITDKETKHFRASINPVYSKNQTIIGKIVLLYDITENVSLLAQLENAAYIDSLTGIYNRKHFYELAAVNIERAMRLNQSIYTAMLDLDFFKNVNDSYGHLAGDIALKNTATIIRQTIRSYDLVGRYGGEEFILLITDLDEVMANNQMERIRENIEHAVINYEGKEIRITCSIGLVKFDKGDTLETTIKKADTAMYSVKSTSRNQVRVYSSSLENNTR